MRSIRRAELLSIGSELTVGETRDTNSGELAGALTAAGVETLRITALPDDLGVVRDAFAHALERADLVVSTGGLGPTPDDLTREAIAAAIGETPSIDAELEAWLRGLFTRRTVPFADANLKQAWILPSVTAIPNANGTAPGWWVDRPDGRIVVALPGPPRELRPMWNDWVMPRLLDRGLGQATSTSTLRTAGIGESAIAERLGSLLERGSNPTIATYARSDAVDIRISATPTATADARTLVADAEREVLARIGEYVWARGAATWSTTIESALSARDWTLAVEEFGTRGSVSGLLAEGLGASLVLAQVHPSEDGAPRHRAGLMSAARAVRFAANVDVALAVGTSTKGADMAVSIAIVDPRGDHFERRLAFIGGSLGRMRAAQVAAHVLLDRLRETV